MDVYPVAVIYSNERQKYTALIEKDPNPFELFIHKPLDWAYEQEERMFMPGMSLDSKIGYDVYGNEIILYDIPEDAITEVVIGCKADRTTELAIFEALNLRKNKCNIYKAKLSENEYRLIFDKIEF